MSEQEDGFRLGQEHVMLVGEAADAYHEFAIAAKQLEGCFNAYTAAKERYNVALAKLSKTATGG